MLDGTKFFQLLCEQAGDLGTDPQPRLLMSPTLRAALDALEIEFRSIFEKQLIDSGDSAAS